MDNSPRACVAITSGLLLLIAFGHGCRTRDESSDGTRTEKLPENAAPVVLFAVDGLEWDIVLPLVKNGKLPNFKRLMNRGCYGILETMAPALSPVVWTTVATGKAPSKHGIHHFALAKENRTKIRLYNNRDRKTKAIWNILSDHQRRVITIGWWLTYPVEEIDGVMVAQTNTTDQLDTRGGKNVWKGMLREGMAGQVFPESRQGPVYHILHEVDSRLAELSSQIFGEFPHPLPALDERLWANCQWSFRADATYLQIALNMLNEQQTADLTMIYFGGPDVVGHRFWRYMQPDIFRHPPSDDQLDNFGTIIEDYYVYADQSLGRLLEACPTGATVLVVSDHGMEPVNQDALFNPDDPPNDINSGHHVHGPPGLFLAAGPCIRDNQQPLEQLTRDKLQCIGNVMDITPTVLAMLRVPLGEDMDGTVLTNIFRGDFRVDQQPVAVSSHDTAEFLASRGIFKPHPAQAERLRQLRSLGYIGGDEEE